jgi:ornithine carbamoyltransferase
METAMTTRATARSAATHFLRVADLGEGELLRLLDVSAEMKAGPPHWVRERRGESVACYFNKPSTRTRVSFETAAYRLGMLPILLRPDELQLSRGEPLSDTGRVLSSYCAAIVVRTFEQSDLEELAGASSVPVINALTDLHHPCQALADLLTIREHCGRLEGLNLTYVGDGNNVAHSLLEACALVGMNVVVACPLGYEPDGGVADHAAEIAAGRGGSVRISNDPREGVRNADIVYTDVWVSMGEESERLKRVTELRDFQVNLELMALANPEAIFMHCLPAHRGQEVSAAVIDGPRSVVFDQAANRLPTEQAVLATATAGRGFNHQGLR